MKHYKNNPLIFDIQHFAIDDGPGIRTSVFFKGCPLSCLWCHNPESIKKGSEIAFHHELCIHCNDCVSVCPKDAIIQENPGWIIREKCNICSKCVDICPSTALQSVGRKYTVAELFEILIDDQIFYDTSNGGVTFSGGEPTLYMDYLSEIMKELKKNSIHITLQTSGMFNLPKFKTKLLTYIDLIYYDIKIFDPIKHKAYTGVSNKRILENFIELSKEEGINIIPVIPLVELTSTHFFRWQLESQLEPYQVLSCPAIKIPDLVV